MKESEKATPITGHEESRLIDIRDIIIAHSARQVERNSADIRELAENIRAAGGVLQPIIVRPDGAKGKYELLAGERRLIASTVAGFGAIKAQVMDVDDVTAQFIAVTENLQRKDLTPLEEAAQLKSLLDKGKEPAAIAADLGRPLSWVIRRARLIALTPEWRMALEGKRPDKVLEKKEYFQPDAFAKWSAGHIELIARYDAEMQNELLREFIQDQYSIEEYTVEDLERELGRKSQLLKKAPWKLDDDSLVPSAGACNACPKRSSHNPGLFEDDLTPEKVAANDKCLDLNCWEIKGKAHVERRTGELREKHPDIIKISDSWQSEKDVMGRDNYEEVKKSDPKARPAVMVSGPGSGQLKWVKLNARGERKPAAREKDKNGKPKPADKKERYKRLQDRRNAHVVGALRELLSPDSKDPRNYPHFSDDFANPVKAMACLVAVFGTRSGFGEIVPADDWKAFNKLLDECHDRPDGDKIAIKALWDRSAGVFIDELSFSTAQDSTKKIPEAKRICELLQLDFATLEKAAEEAIPVPKSWAKLDSDQKAKKPATKAPREARAPEVEAKPKPAAGVCRVCGCTDDKACEGGCVWIEPDLCSKCYEKMSLEGNKPTKPAKKRQVKRKSLLK